MRRVYILCEGQTEEAFVNEVLYDWFMEQDVFVTPIICTTKRTKTQKFTGGVSDYGKLRKELTSLCRMHRHELVTTMFDYYAMPSDTPGLTCTVTDPAQRALEAEAAVNADIGERNLAFNYLMHEFEALLFSRPEAFVSLAGETIAAAVAQIRSAYPTPEHINHSTKTAPSKRLLQLMPRYRKIFDGLDIAKSIGMATMRAECPHFRDWTTKIVRLAHEA